MQDTTPAWTLGRCGRRLHTALLCDDFESAERGRRIPPLAVDARRRGAQHHARTRRQQLRVTSARLRPRGGGDRQQAIGIDLTNTITDVWLRFYAYVPSTSLPNNIGITSLADAAGDNDSILLNDGGWAFYAQGPDVYRGEVPLTPDHWTCLSYHAVLTNPGSVTLTVDHLTPLSATGINAAFATGIDNAEIGLDVRRRRADDGVRLLHRRRDADDRRQHAALSVSPPECSAK